MRHANDARVLGFSKDDQSIVSIGLDNGLRVWDLKTGTSKSKLSMPRRRLSFGDSELQLRSRYMSDCLLMPEGKSILVAKSDGKIEQVDFKTKSVRTVFQAETESPRITMSPRGKWLALTTFHGELKTANASLISLEGYRAGVNGGFKVEAVVNLPPHRCLCVNENGSLLATGDSEGVTVWDIETGKPLWSQPMNDVGSRRGIVVNLTFSGDGSRIAAGTSIGDVKVWGTATGNQMFSASYRSTIGSTAMSGDGDLIAIASGNRVSLHQLSSDQVVWQKDVRTGRTASVAFNHSGDRLAVSSGNQIKVLETVTGDEILFPAISDVTTSIAMLQNGSDQLILGKANGVIEIRDLVSRQIVRSWQTHQEPIDLLVVSPQEKADGDHLVSLSHNSIGFWDTKSGNGSVHQKHNERALSSWNSPPLMAGLSSNASQLIWLSKRGAVTFWDMNDGKLADESVFPRLRAPLVAVADGNVFVSSTENRGGLELWSLESKERVQVLPGPPGARGRATTAVVSGDNGKIAFCGYRQPTRIWDRESNQFLDLKDRPPLLPYASMAFSPSGKFLATGGGSGQVQIWDTSTGENTQTVRVGPSGGIIRSICWNPNGKQWIALSMDGMVSCVDLK